MSIETELQQALDTIDSMEQHTADAYAALQRNGASLPEKCNLANLAGVVEENTILAEAAVVQRTNGATHIAIKGYKAGSTSAAQEFSRQCGNSYNNTSGRLLLEYLANAWVTGEIGKGVFTEIYLDFENGTPNYTGYLIGGSASDYGFRNLQKVTIKNTPILYSNTLQYAFNNNDPSEHELFLENIGEIKDAFLYYSKFNGKLALPDGLITVGVNFCFACNNLKELYIPAGCTPPTDANSLSVSDASVPAYANGIVLKGPGAKAWKAALPDLTSLPYRKLILDPEWA